MCGVAAAFAYANGAPTIDRDELRAVRDAMAARGPDGAGEWFSARNDVGLAHRRLAIIDLSARAAQPMASADGQLVISFNGEIYNHRELRSQLVREGRVFLSDSDTEVLLHLYETRGTAMLTMLRGMFAFAIWDARRGEMLLARDAFGIKPLYYADDGRTVRAASQVRALVRAKVDTSPQPAGHVGFLLWGSVPEPWTLYRGIHAVPAGHFVRVSAAGVCPPEPYLRVRELLAGASLAPSAASRSKALEAIAAAVHDSVRAHLVSDVPVGIFLSAGLDSVMLASAMKAAGARPHSITLGFDALAAGAEDETSVAAELARILDIPHAAHAVTREEFTSQLPEFLSAMDQPSIDGVNTWFVARAAAAAGMKVAVSGVGGDELFASYPSFRQVPALAHRLRWPARIPGAGWAVRRLSAPVLRRWGSPKYAGLLEYGGSMGGAYLLRRGLVMPWELPEWMDPDMAREGWCALAPLAHLDAECRMPDSSPADRLKVASLETAFYMRNQLLRDADWAGMAHSLEIRVPFVDVRLLESTLPHIAAHPDIEKSEVARAVAPGLPERWSTRAKTGFRVPVREWMAASAGVGRGLRPWARVVLEHAQRSHAGVPSRPRVLVSTLEPGIGGVQSMTALVVDTLSRRGLEPVIAHYATYPGAPALSVPSYRLMQRSVGWRPGQAYGGHASNAIGAWLPELEFTHYAATRRWRELIASCSAYVAVSGNVLAATPFWQCERPYLAWVATDWQGDRHDRVQAFHPLRKILDRAVNAPVIRWLERRLLRGGQVLPLSEFTRNALARIASAPPFGPTLPSGIDTTTFVPDAARRVPGRIGFVGRFMDPRKNIGLLLHSLALLRQQGHEAHAMIIGDTVSSEVVELAGALGLTGRVEFVPPVSREELVPRLQSFDVLVIPSHQEGLCIAALEAMACGVPVVSTRCGGPEEFVIDGQTGFLAGFDAAAIADRVAVLLVDREAHERMAQGARRMAHDRYSVARTRELFWDSFSSIFPHVAAAAKPV